MVKAWEICRRLLAWILAMAVCFILCVPFVLGAQGSYIRVSKKEQILSGGSFVLLAAYPSGEEASYYAIGTTLDRKLDAVPVGSQTPESEIPVWTIAAAGDGISLFNGREYLSYDSDAYFGSGDVPYAWSLTEGEDGTFRFATPSGRTIGYYDNNGSGRFGPYDLSESWDSQYQFDLLVYKLGASEEPEETTKPQETSSPQETTKPEEETLPSGNGVLWLKSGGVALSGTMDAFGYLTGTAVTPEGEILAGYGPENIWTLELGAEGTIHLLYQGQKLSLPENCDALQWDGVNSGWKPEKQTDGTWLIQNAGRPDRYLCWNSVLRTWHAGELPRSGWENFRFTFTPAQPNVVLPQASPVTISPDGGELYPAGGAAITLTTETPGGEIYYALSVDGTAYSEFALYTQPISPETGFGKLWVKAYASAPGFENSPETAVCFTERTSYYGFYFGQLHAHTNLSDGLGAVEEAFIHASQVENLDFLAVTDHSDSFDNELLGSLAQDGTTVSQAWQRGKAAAAGATSSEFVGIFGFEMTWNKGQGHISTFATPGWASRDQAVYSDLHTSLKNYYADLASVPGSVSQFNHPGSIHGSFEEFSNYSEAADKAITLIEVYNFDVGEFFDAYIKALDKGWHVAPTCNQDNHSGGWGSLDSGRTVVLASALTEANIYDAMRNYRVYATRDSDLKIRYTLDGSLMGSRLYDYGSEVTLRLSLSDATDGPYGTVEVIGSGGAVAASQSLDSSGSLSVTLPSDSRYYFLRITQSDGDVAVTAPVWLEKEATLEITRFAPDSPVTVAGEAQQFAVEFTNRTPVALSGAVITVTDGSGQVLASGTLEVLPGESNVAWSFTHTFEKDGLYPLTVIITAGGRTIAQTLTVTVLPRSIISDVIVDGTHGAVVKADHLIAVAADAGIRAHVETRQITEEQLTHCSLLIIPTPSVDFSQEFMELAAAFVSRGGNLLLCGSSDGASPGGADRINGLLAAVSSTMTLSDDTVYDPVNNGGTPEAVFPETIVPDSPWTKGIREGQFYCQWEGCSVNPGSGTALVQGFPTTFSVDGDFNGLEKNGESYRALPDGSGMEILYDLVKGRGAVCLMAAEQTAGGMVFLCGGGFPFDDSLNDTQNNPWNLPYANRTIFENILGILREEPQVTPIAQVRRAEEGETFLIEGYITAGTANPNTCLPDTIYVQDDTGGIAVVPYNEYGLELGTKVRVTGVVKGVHGDIHLQLIDLKVLEGENRIEPQYLDNQTAMDYAASGGLIVRIEGTVTAVTFTDDGTGVTNFTVMDDRGETAWVLIEDGVSSAIYGFNDLAKGVQVGNRVSAVGLVHYREGTVLRVRNCDEVLLLWEPPEEPDTTAPRETTAPPTNGNPPTGDPFPLELIMTCVMGSLFLLALLSRNKEE